MQLNIPEMTLVVLVGPSGCGKSTFAAKHFKPSEILSSDYCRGLVADDENDQSASADAFDLLHYWLDLRLKRGRLTVIDATNVEPANRRTLVEIAKKRHVLSVAIVFDIPTRICADRNKGRADRDFGPHVIQRQASALRRSFYGMRREGFLNTYVFKSPSEADAAEIIRTPLWNDRKSESGPFDIVGDVHGCIDELKELLAKLGYDGAAHPDGRKVVFVGDLVDRGPDSPSVLKLAMEMVQAGTAFCVPGNHDVKLMRKLRGKDVQLTHGLEKTMEQLESETEEFKRSIAEFIDGMVSHLVFDKGELVVAHAGLKEEMQGRGSARVRDFALYGDTTGETDEFGLPVRYPWATDYRGQARVVYGHTPVPEPGWLNRTINIDTGCAFGGKLTALRYPELELVSVPAKETYAEPARPFLAPKEVGRHAQHVHDDVLDLQDITGRRHIETPYIKAITIREENAFAAVEIMSRFAVDPKWLIYLPPTMSPSETSSRTDLLEHPDEAFAYFQAQGVEKVVCEEKHMGSRAVVMVVRDPAVAVKRFGLNQPQDGCIYTRTGRQFFVDRTVETELLLRIRNAAENSGLWDELATDWLCLDCELMPWSAKAQELLRRQFVPVGVAAGAVMEEAESAFVRALSRVPSDEQSQGLSIHLSERLDSARRYRDAYRRYCWPVSKVEDYKIAPFHVMASEGAVHVDKDHLWHMRTLRTLCESDPEVLLPTPLREVELTDLESVKQAVNWWEELTDKGGEGMVVKPLSFIAKGPKDWVQPALKCRGREYLRIIYGPDYTSAENLTRLRQRAVMKKRSLALREFSIGVEGLNRFVAGEPLRRVHECAFGVLALESEPVDPRL